MDSSLRSRVASLLDSEVVDAQPTSGGYSGSRRWVVSLDNGSSAFVKAAGRQDHTRVQLREEARFYQSFQRSCTPELYAFEDDPESPLLILEDLSHATWPPPWTTEHVDNVLDTLRQVAAEEPPEYLPSLEQYRETLSGWERVEEDPSPFLGMGLATEAWLESALPILKQASTEAVLAGPSLVHFDVRSDNLAFLTDRTVLVDWSIPAIGNPLADIVGWLPSLHVEGGPHLTRSSETKDQRW
ncbi:MAG: phosphotransferase family protein [Actinomycetota bacterium]